MQTFIFRLNATSIKSDWLQYLTDSRMSIDPNLLTKKALLAWVSEQLHLPSHSIEQLSNGVVFCRLLDLLAPGCPRLKKINESAHLEHENLRNLKTLSTAMLEIGIDKKFDVARIANKKTHDILELLQWFRKFAHFGAPLNGEPSHARHSSIVKYQLGEGKSAVSGSAKSKTSRLIAPESLNIKGAVSSQCKKRVHEDSPSKAPEFYITLNKSISRIAFDINMKESMKIEMIRRLLVKDCAGQQVSSRQAMTTQRESSSPQNNEAPNHEVKVQPNNPLKTDILSEAGIHQTPNDVPKKQISLESFNSNAPVYNQSRISNKDRQSFINCLLSPRFPGVISSATPGRREETGSKAEKTH